MARNASYHVQFRRRRSGKTNYHRRKRLLRSEKHRLVVRRSNKHQRVSIIEAKVIGDITLIDATSQHLKEYGWKGTTGNVPAAYLTGYLAGKYAKASGIKEAILDIGINACRKDTRISAMLCGVVDAGLNIPHNPDIFPSEDRYTGKIIADYATELKKKDPSAYDKQFSGYKKLSAKPESLNTYFKATLKAIDDEFNAGTMKTKLKNRNKKNLVSKSKPKTITPKKPTTPKKTATPTTPKKTTTPKTPTTTTPKKTSTPAKTPTTTKKTTTPAAKETTTKKPTPTSKKQTTSKSPTTKKSTPPKSSTTKKASSAKKPSTNTKSKK
ncbi:MAG: 50S ribosomal protein L18 [Asgard group archaeon]|nr:50S ribosomal protein L18 [Asgard group archaeon]